MKTNTGNKNRRIFLQLISAGIVTVLTLIWAKLTLSHLNFLEHKRKFFAINGIKPVSFFDDYIVIRQDDTTAVFSSHCTHLGCKISGTSSGKLVCPCHGSEYDTNGNVVRGPAFKSLKKVPFKISADGNQIEITG